jgi:hypothetical protein
VPSSHQKKFCFETKPYFDWILPSESNQAESNSDTNQQRNKKAIKIKEAWEKTY